ncbi:MAG: hypothetical protein J6T48_02990 [Bacteroidales bacterium]|nr:hypothetical protein [Bacteroidales bacterium]
MKARLISNNILHLLMFVCFYLVMLYEYFDFVVPLYAVNNFVLSYSTTTICVGFVMLFALLVRLFINKSISDFSYAISMFVAITFAVPAIIMYQFGNCTIFAPLYSILFVYAITSKYIVVPKFNVKGVQRKHRLGILILMSLLFLVPFVMTYKFNLNIKAFSFGSELYEARAAAKSSSNIFTSYLMGPLTKVLLPIAIILGIKEKKLWMSIIGILLMLYMFAVNPHKALFLSIFLIVAFYFFDNYKAKAGLILSGILILIFTSIFVSATTGNILAESIFVRRMFFLPVQICNYCFDFYDGNPIYLSHSVLSSLNDYPYSLEPAFLMGDYMYGKPGTSCNTGIIADGFMNFGHIGSILFVMVTAVIIKFIESLNIDKTYFGIVIAFVMLFLNSALLTSMLTHGGLFLLLILIFFMKDTDNDKNMPHNHCSSSI